MTDNVIIFGSAKEAKTYKPSKPTVMFGLCDLVEEALLVPKEVALNNRLNLNKSILGLCPGSFK